jgi:hypothetical protein
LVARSAEKGHGELVSRIREAGERWKRRTAGLGAVRTAVLVLASLTALVALESFVALPLGIRVAWLGVTVAFLVFGLAVWVVRPLLRAFDPVELAARIEERAPELGENLESAAELWRKRGKGRHGYSVELIDALIMRTIEEASGLTFSIVPDQKATRRTWRAMAAVALVSALAAALLGPRLGPALYRVTHPLEIPEYEAATITVTPGDTTLVSGEDLVVTALLSGPCGTPPALLFEPEGDRPAERTMERVGTGEEYRAAIADVRSPLRYSVSTDEVSSRTYNVRVLEYPFITALRLEYAFPRYSGLLPRTVDENNGDITALTGTTVHLTVTSSKPLETAELVAEPGGRTPLERLGPATFAADMRVVGDGRYSIEMADVDGLANPDPPQYSIVAIRDERPLVRIVEPGEDREAPRGMTLPIVISALDDYGITEVSIRYSLEGSIDETVVPIEHHTVSGPRELSSEFDWDLSETGLTPGRSLVYYAEVIDNDQVTGPKSARSESYLIRFPSMSELYSEVAGDQDDIIFELDEMLDEQQALREEFEDIQEDVRSEPEMDWQEEERVEETLERQEQLAEDVLSMAERMDDLADAMSETDRVTLETLEKVDEISRLLEEVATEEMRELIMAIREAMERLSPQDVSEAMENLSFTQDDYLRRLEQTLNLLKRARAEQQLADIANRAEDLASREEQLAREAAEAEDGADSQAMAEEQERIRQETEQMLADLAAAIESMKEVDRETADEMAEALSESEACQISETMEKARSKLSESKPSEASQMCQSASSDLLTLFTRISQCQGGMSCQIQNRDREATLRAIDELLTVSAEQEEIVEAVEGRHRIPRSELVELVAKEADLAESMLAIANRMFEVSKDSYVIDPGIYRSFGHVQMMMTRSASGIAGGGSAAGLREARQALGSVNALIVGLLSANQSSSGSSGGALDQLMQQLQQMSQQQSRLNQMTEELRSLMEQMGMSQGFDRQLAEMRGEQEKLLEEARRLAREFGDRREILGRLDDTVEEMERTLEEMERSGASQETIDRQKRILSRMLDAQRSLRRRDYTRRRASTAGGQYARSGPEGLPEDVARVTQELREDLLRAMQRGYPTEYRPLIRAYFQNLTSDAEPDGGSAAGRSGAEDRAAPAAGGTSP